MNWDTYFLQTAPYKVAYKGKIIGITQDSPLLNIEPEFYEAKRDHNGVSKIVMNMKINISMEIEEVDIGFAKDMQDTGGSLTLLPVSEDDNISYCFPKAVFVPNTEENCYKISFEVYEDSEGVLIKKF